MFAVGLQFLFLLTCGVTLGQSHHAVRMVVPEGGDALFPASISRDAEADYFEWKKVGPGGETLDVFKYDAGLHYNNKGLSGQSEQFKGRVSHFHYKLKYGNASIVIGNTTAADSGNYSCSFPRVQPPLNFYLELVVAAAPKPSVTVLTPTAGEQESEDSRGAMLMVGIFPIVSLAVILAAVVALLLFTKSIKILHKKGSALKGRYTIDMGDGLIIDLSKQRLQSDDGLIIDRSKQSDEGSRLKGKYMIDMGDGLIIHLSKQRPQSDDGLIIDRSKQSDEDSPLKGEEESDMDYIYDTDPSDEPLKPFQC